MELKGCRVPGLGSVCFRFRIDKLVDGQNYAVGDAWFFIKRRWDVLMPVVCYYCAESSYLWMCFVLSARGPE